MAKAVDLRVERLRRLRVRPEDVWQGAMVRMPHWITGEKGRKPYRPDAPVWTSRASGRMHIGELKPPEESKLDDVVEALFEFVGKRGIGWRPGTIEATSCAWSP